MLTLTGVTSHELYVLHKLLRQVGKPGVHLERTFEMETISRSLLKSAQNGIGKPDLRGRNRLGTTLS